MHVNDLRTYAAGLLSTPESAIEARPDTSRIFRDADDGVLKVRNPDGSLTALGTGATGSFIRFTAEEALDEYDHPDLAGVTIPFIIVDGAILPDANYSKTTESDTITFAPAIADGSRVTILLSVPGSSTQQPELYAYPKHAALTTADIGKHLMATVVGDDTKAAVYTYNPEIPGTPGVYTLTVNALSQKQRIYSSCKVTFLQVPRDGVDTITIYDNHLINFSHTFTFVNTVSDPDTEILIGADEAETAANTANAIEAWKTGNEKYYVNAAVDADNDEAVIISSSSLYEWSKAFAELLRLTVFDTDYLHITADGDFTGYVLQSSYIIINGGSQSQIITAEQWNHVGAPVPTPVTHAQEAENIATYLAGLEMLEPFDISFDGNVITVEAAATDDDYTLELIVGNLDALFATDTEHVQTIPSLAGNPWLGTLYAIEGDNAIISRPAVAVYTLDEESFTDLGVAPTVFLCPTDGGTALKNPNSEADLIGICGIAIQNADPETSVLVITAIPTNLFIALFFDDFGG